MKFLQISLVLGFALLAPAKGRKNLRRLVPGGSDPEEKEQSRELNSEPTWPPVPVPKPVPKPTPKPTPHPTPRLILKPTAKPTAKPTPKPVPKPVPHPNTGNYYLQDIGNPNGAYQLGMCQGDCDPENNDCAPGYYCYDDKNSPYVPGCQGTRYYNANRNDYNDYCTASTYPKPVPVPKPTPDPTPKPVPKPTPKPVPVPKPVPHPPQGNYYLQDVGNPNGAYKLGMCQGDCDPENNDCAPGYYCYDDKYSPYVPGCQGTRYYNTNRQDYNDYCTAYW